MEKYSLDSLIKRMIVLGLASAILMALGYYLVRAGRAFMSAGNVPMPSSLALSAIGEFLIVTAFLLIMGTIALIVVWAVKAART